MLHGGQILIVAAVYLLIVLFALTMLWRIASALGKIADQLTVIAQDVKKLADRS